MKRLVLVLMLSLAALVGPVLAQESPALATLDISIWPEYDRPEVLVIYRGQLDSGVSLPVSLEIAVPARVGEPTAVAYVDENGERLNQQYTTRVEGDSLIVSFQLISQAFQLEYYDTLPIDSDGRRAYTYTFAADYATTEVNLEFQVPPTAQGFEIAPPADTQVSAGNGLTYHLVEAGTLAAGDTLEWTMSYLKDNDELTEAGLVQAAPSAPTPAPAGGTGDSTVWIFLISFVALIGVGVTGYWLGHRTQVGAGGAQPARQPRKRRGSGQGAQSPRPPLRGRARFCHQCGADLRSDSAFCHSCGAPVRDE